MAYRGVSRVAACAFYRQGEVAAVVVNAKPVAVLRESPRPTREADVPTIL